METLDTETLMNLLKDKAKEMKIMEKKLGKAEKQYVKVFKENKDLIKDRQTFEEFMKVIFT
jgi:hypothetical protein